MTGPLPLPLTDEMLPQLLLFLTRRWPDKFIDDQLVVTVVERRFLPAPGQDPDQESDPASQEKTEPSSEAEADLEEDAPSPAGTADVEGDQDSVDEPPHRPNTPPWAAPLVHASDHMAYVYPARLSGHFHQRLTDHYGALGLAVISSMPTALPDLDLAYDGARVSMRLIAHGLAARPPGPCSARQCEPNDVDVYLGRGATDEVAALLRPLAEEPPRLRLRLAHTLSERITRHDTNRRVALVCQVSESTLRNHLNRLYELLGDTPSEPRNTVLLLAALPHLLHLWEAEAESGGPRSQDL